MGGSEAKLVSRASDLASTMCAMMGESDVVSDVQVGSKRGGLYMVMRGYLLILEEKKQDCLRGMF